jgi:hypothetical protein
MPLEKLRPGKKLKLGFRAEHVAPEQGAAPGLSPKEGVMQGEVEAQKHLGPRAYLHTRTPRGSSK